MTTLTQQALIKTLAEAGYPITRTTLLRYVQCGFVMKPKQLPSRQTGDRIYYHPLAIIEAMTATLLFRGDFLEPKSALRIARLTDVDIFIGRLDFYSKFIKNPFPITSFYTSTDKFEAIPPIKMLENIDTGNPNNVKVALESCLYEYSKALPNINDSKYFVSSYKIYMGELYEATFEHLLKKHISTLKAFSNY